MKRSMWMLPVALLLVFGIPTYAAEPPSGQEARKNALPKPGVKIAKWISQLGNDEFKVREQATQGLAKAGANALPALLKATKSKQVEVRNRAFGTLFAMSKSDNQATANAVLAVCHWRWPFFSTNWMSSYVISLGDRIFFACAT